VYSYDCIIQHCAERKSVDSFEMVLLIMYETITFTYMNNT